MADAPVSQILRHIYRLADPPAEQTDGQLLQRFVGQRDENAFAALLRRHGRLVWSVCRHRLHHEHDAEDAFQATFLVLARRAAGIRKRESVASWLHGVAFRIARKAMTTTVNRQQRERRSAVAEIQRPPAELAARELQALLDEEVERLPAKCRVAFVSCCLEGRSRKEAAAELGWKLGTLSCRVAEARRLLQHRLARRGVTLSAALTAGVLWNQPSSAALVEPTLRAAVRVASGERVHAVADSSVVTLAESGMKRVGACKLGVAAAILMTTTIAIGWGWAISQNPDDRPAQANPVSQTKEREPKADLYGDPLPPGALARMGTVRFRNANLVGGILYSPDGKLLASAGYGGMIRLHDPATGKEIRSLEVPCSQLPSVAFSQDGSQLAVSGSKTIQIWDVAAGKEIRRFAADVENDFYSNFVAPLVFSPDGKTLASVAQDQSVRIWDARDGKEIQKLVGDGKSVRCLRFSSDGKQLFSATGDGVQGGSMRLWDTATGKEVRKFTLHSGGSAPQLGSPLAFSVDGKLLAFQSHEILRRKNVPMADRLDWQVVSIVDTDAGEVRLKLEPERGRFKAAAFSPDGKMLATVHGVQKVTNFVQSEDDNRVRVWDAATGKLLFDFAGYSEHESFRGPGIVAFSPDGKQLAAAGSGPALHVWDLTKGREHLEKSEAHHHEVLALAFSRDGRMLATGSSDCAVALWDAGTGKQVGRLRGHEGPVAGLAFSADGKLFASASRWNEQAIRVWELASGKQLRNYSLPSVDNGDGTSTGVNTWIAFAAGGKVLAAGGTDRKVRLWDVASGRPLLDEFVRRRAASLVPQPAWVSSIAFTVDGGTMAFGTDKAIYVVDSATGQGLYQIDKGGSNLAFSPSGNTLAFSGPGNCVRIAEVASGKELHVIEVPDSVLATAFSPSGRHVAVASSSTGGTIVVLDARTGKEVLRFQGHGSYVRCLAFSPDGTKLASGYLDSTALVWDVTPALAAVKPQPTNLGARELEQLWNDLRDADATKAQAAVWTLADAPEQAISLLQGRLKPVAKIQPERLQQLLADLDAEDFATRDSASKELGRLGIEVEAALRKALEDRPTLEKRRRLESLLKGLAAETEMSADLLRDVRSVQVLEMIGSRRAHDLLAKLAGGATIAPITRGAKAALERMAGR